MATAELIQNKTSSTTNNTPSPSPSKPKTTCFLGCFGISRKVSSGLPTTSRSKSSSFPETDYIPSHHDDHLHLHLHLHQHHKINKPNDVKMKTRSTTSPRCYLISWSSWRFCASSKSATKTVPIDASGTGTGKRQRHSKAVKSSFEKTKSISESGKFVSDAERTVSVTDAELPGGPSQREDVLLSPVSDLQQTQNSRPQTTSNTIILENMRRQLESSKDDTCQKRLSFRRKIDSLRSGGGGGGGGSQPGSPVKQEEKKPKSSSRRTASSAVMPPSGSFPIPSQKRQSGRSANPALPVPHNKHSSSWSTVKTKADDGHQHRHQAMTLMVSNKKKKKNLDPLAGMSIIVVTLIIMLFWGRLCAILYTSAWFYFLPRFTSSAAATATTTPIISYLDLNSEEYKKKVVLEGFLERNNHRNNNNNI